MDHDDLSIPANPSLGDVPVLEGMIERMKRDQTRLENRAAKASSLPSSLRDIPKVGRYMLPSEQTYAAHRELIQDRSLGLDFKPSSMPGFDATCASTPAAMQENLAIIRNYIMGYYFADHAYQPDVDRLASIGNYLGTQKASAGGKEAQRLYALLLKRQQTPLLFMPSAWFAKVKPQQWNLPPLKDSPFSDDALNRPAPKPDNAVSFVGSVEFAEMTERNSFGAPEQQTEQTAAEELNAIANDMASAGALTMSVEDLHEPTKRESIRLAKEILDKLKMKLGQAFVGHGLGAFEFERLAILGELKEVVKAFEFHLHKVAGLDANIYENPAVTKANEAVGKLSYLAKQETMAVALQHGDAQMIALLEADLMQFPKSWMPSETDTFASLFDNLESGLEAVLDRINQIGDKDTSAEFWLGFSNEKAIGAVDPTKGGTGKQQKTSLDDQYYRQLNAQRALRARQAAVRYTQTMQRQRAHAHDDDHPHPPQQTARPSMSTLLSDDMINVMRNSMKTSANAGAVETGTKANVQQVIKQKDQAMKAQRQRIVVEQVTRANKRSQEMRDQPDEPTPPPPHKKKDHGHGV